MFYYFLEINVVWKLSKMPVLSKFMSFRERRYREKKKIRLAIMYMMMEMLDPVQETFTDLAKHIRCLLFTPRFACRHELGQVILTSIFYGLVGNRVHQSNEGLVCKGHAIINSASNKIIRNFCILFLHIIVSFPSCIYIM